VTVAHEFDRFQPHPWAVEEARRNPKMRFSMKQRVLEFVGRDALEQVVVAHQRTGEITRVPADGAFVFIGYVPNTAMLKGQVELTRRGETVTDDALWTRVPGVFAARDARAKRWRQIATAVADGAGAALEATEYPRGAGLARAA
jgi:thioredoxin reductase (NADPH)